MSARPSRYSTLPTEHGRNPSSSRSHTCTKVPFAASGFAGGGEGRS